MICYEKKCFRLSYPLKLSEYIYNLTLLCVHLGIPVPEAPSVLGDRPGGQDGVPTELD